MGGSSRKGAHPLHHPRRRGVTLRRHLRRPEYRARRRPARRRRLARSRISSPISIAKATRANAHPRLRHAHPTRGSPARNRWRVPLLGVIDFLPLLSKPSLADIESVLNAKLISGGERRGRTAPNWRVRAVGTAAGAVDGAGRVGYAEEERGESSGAPATPIAPARCVPTAALLRGRGLAASLGGVLGRSVTGGAETLPSPQVPRNRASTSDHCRNPRPLPQPQTTAATSTTRWTKSKWSLPRRAASCAK